MWAQYMAYIENFDGAQPRQIFVTKNDILRNEVEKSFRNMALAWRKSVSNQDIQMANRIDKPTETEQGIKPAANSKGNFPLFLTAAEWLDILDNELPGDRFFSQQELDERIGKRKVDDTVQRSMETFFADETVTLKDEDNGVQRQEMTYDIFRKLWCKINSAVKTSHDPALVWREIKSYIKGSVAALRIKDTDRSVQQNRFLSLPAYLSLPRKQSRLNETQRRDVYRLYLCYEKLKKERFFFDESDLVYNLAGRVSQFACIGKSDGLKGNQGLLPTDAVFVDEVQDFTQAELYLLTKLNTDPNNIMLAGDTAQSIAVGVGFRFTDVRQIFYESFGGIEPHLLQLTHNYRSHAGVLRLAACVVELLYFFSVIV